MDVAVLEASEEKAGRPITQSHQPSVPLTEKPWLSIGEVAQLLNVSKKTIQRLPIPRTRVGRLPRFSRQVVEKFMSDRQEVPIQVDLSALTVVATPNFSQPRLPQRSRRKFAKAERAAHLLKLLKGG